jgi:peptidoglycan/LPS O-acetylase OafA/YrhL
MTVGNPVHRYETLDGLRGVAAIAIVIFHICAFARLPHLLPSAYVAVDLFFILSGFVVAQTYGPRISAGLSVRHYVGFRLIRIMPLYLVSLAMGGGAILLSRALGLADFSNDEFVVAVSASLFILPLEFNALGIFNTLPLNGPSWTLFFELLANFAYFPLVVFLTVRWLAVGAFIGLLGLAFTVVHYGTLHAGYDYNNILGAIPRMLFGFAVGTLFSMLGWSKATIRSSNIAVALLVVAAAIFAARFTNRQVSDLIFVAGLLPLVVALGIKYQPATASVSALCTWLGRLSFPIYILHTPLIYLAMFASETGIVPPDLAMVVWVILPIPLFALSWALLVAFDEPLRNKLAAGLWERMSRAAA